MTARWGISGSRDTCIPEVIVNRILRAGAAVAAALALGIAGMASAAGASAPAPLDPNDAASPSGQVRPLAITSNLEDVFVPVAPCRIVDTRQGAGTNGTPLTSLQTRTYYVGGTFGFAPQGGKSGGCGIPVGAVAIAATVTAVGPEHAGWIRAWPNGQSEPTATLLNYAGSSIGSGATVPVATNSAFALKVRNYGGPTDLVIDVAGYYRPQIQAQLGINGGVSSGSPRVVSSLNIATGQYRVTLDRDVSDCSANSNPDGSGGYIVNTFASGSTVTAYAYSLTGVPTNIYWQLHITC